MKYCKKCGVSIPDDATFCPTCGARVEEDKVVDVPVIEPSKTVNTRPDQKGIETAAVVFLILGCIGNILTAYYKDPARVGYLCLIPLCWSIPMIVHAFRVFRKGERMGVGFKVCSLLFVSLIGGIILLCRKEEN